MNSAVNYGLMTKLITLFLDSTCFNIFLEMRQCFWLVGYIDRVTVILDQIKKTYVWNSRSDTQIGCLCFYIWKHERAREHVCSKLCNSLDCTHPTSKCYERPVTLPHYWIQSALRLSSYICLWNVKIQIMFGNLHSCKWNLVPDHWIKPSFLPTCICDIRWS